MNLDESKEEQLTQAGDSNELPEKSEEESKAAEHAKSDEVGALPKKNNEKSKVIGRYALSSLSILVFSLLFSVLSLILTMVPAWVRIVGSFVFIVPSIMIIFHQGKVQGEKLYKKCSTADLSDIHSEQGIKLPYYKSVYHVIGFVGFMFIMLVLTVAIKNNILQFITMLFEFPMTLLFWGVLDFTVVSPILFAIFVPYTLILAGTFVGGYVLQAYKLKRQRGDIENELRSYDN